jgi:hypothetical protein
MTDPRTEAHRLGFWDEGLVQYRTEREDDPTDDCD